MTAFADLNELVNRMSGGNSGLPEYWFGHKESRVAGAAAAALVVGRLTSLLRYEGSPGHGVAPTTVVAPDNTLAGSFRHTAATGGRQKWLPYIWGSASVQGTLIIYDRLLHIGGLSGTVTTAQTVGGTLTRNTGGIGNQIWAEIYSPLGATLTTITANYTGVGGAGTTSVATPIGGTNLNNDHRIIPLSLAAGDNLVSAVASVTLAASTLTAGNFGISIVRPIAMIGVSVAGIGGTRSFIDGNMPDISTSCLCAAWYPQATTAPTFDMFFSAAER